MEIELQVVQTDRRRLSAEITRLKEQSTAKQVRAVLCKPQASKTYDMHRERRRRRFETAEHGQASKSSVMQAGDACRAKQVRAMTRAGGGIIGKQVRPTRRTGRGGGGDSKQQSTAKQVRAVLGD